MATQSNGNRTSFLPSAIRLYISSAYGLSNWCVVVRPPLQFLLPFSEHFHYFFSFFFPPFSGARTCIHVSFNTNLGATLTPLFDLHAATGYVCSYSYEVLENSETVPM